MRVCSTLVDWLYADLQTHVLDAIRRAGPDGSPAKPVVALGEARCQSAAKTHFYAQVRAESRRRGFEPLSLGKPCTILFWGPVDDLFWLQALDGWCDPVPILAFRGADRTRSELVRCAP